LQLPYWLDDGADIFVRIALIPELQYLQLLGLLAGLISDTEHVPDR
jgi:hypothetical protein